MSSLHTRMVHPEYIEGCFGCRVSTVSVGDKTGEQAKWDKELALYRSAREQGISPASTKTPAIRRALDVSDRIGAAYDASAGLKPLESS